MKLQMTNHQYKKFLRRKYKELKAGVIVCRDINDAGEGYLAPNADAAQALCNLFSLVSNEKKERQK